MSFINATLLFLPPAYDFKEFFVSFMRPRTWLLFEMARIFFIFVCEKTVLG